MKKYVFIIILTLIILTPGARAEEIEDRSLVDPLDVIFQSSLTNVVHELNDQSDEYDDDKYFQKIDPERMPIFKQIRLKIANKRLEMSEKPKVSLIERIKSLRKKNSGLANVSEDISVTETNELANTINQLVTSDSDDTLSLEGGINAEKTENQLMLDSDNINFDDETGDMVATGRPVLYLPPQDTKIVADNMSYNDGGNILKADGDVIITKKNIPVYTDSLEINMNEETLTMDKMTAKVSGLNINAQSAVQQDGLVIFNKGNMTSDKDFVYRITSRMVGPDFQSMLIDSTPEDLFFGNPEKNKLDISASTIEIDARKNHDVIRAKKLRFSHNGKVFFKWPSITMYTNKQHSYFEGNYPEIGSKRKLGLFAGPGFAFGGPFGSVVKVIPFLNYRKDFGIGGMLKYHNTNNYTELGYGTSKSIFFLRGKQRLDDNFYLHYAYNSYANEWFLGGRMPKYIAELYYDKSYLNKDFLGEKRNMTFRQRASFGFMKDDNKSYNGERYNDFTNMSTTRTRYMAEIAQTLFSYNNKKNRAVANFGIAMQGSAALYGTGDTQFIARVGPYLRLQYKNWMQDINYYLSGYDDHSPLPHFDAYRYGNSSIRITEAIRLSKYLTVGWVGYVNLSDDSPNKKLFQENAFVVSVGPDDFKVVLGYDFIRERTYLGFNIALNSKGTTVNYDKLVIKNPERLGKSDENERKVAFAQNQKEEEIKTKFARPQPYGKAPILEYATVIDLEDPVKERID